MNRREFITTAAVGAAAMAFPRLAESEEAGLKPVWAQMEKQHDQAVQRLQQWIRQPSIAAENRGVNEGCELTMSLLRDAGFSNVTRSRPTASRGFSRSAGTRQRGARARRVLRHRVGESEGAGNR